MSRAKPLALALLVALTATATAPDAFAQKKKSTKKAKAPAVSAECSDFYSATNDAWLSSVQAPAGTATITALGTLRAQSEQQQRDLLDAAMAAPQHNVQKLLGDFWASGLDQAAVEADGANSIAPLLTRINGIRRGKDVPAAIAALHQVGIPVVFNFGADVDLNDLNRHIGYFGQGGTALPDPAFYTRQDADTQALMKRYRNYVGKILTLTGTPASKLEAETQSVLDLETRIATASRPLSALRDPRGNYAQVPIADLKKQYRNLQLAEFLQVQGVQDDVVSIANPALFQQLDGLIGGIKADQWKSYLRYQVGVAMAPYLSKSFREADFEFNGRVLMGLTDPLPWWRQTLDAINLAAGPMLGREYAERHLPAATRSRAGTVAGEIRDALVAAIDANTWMSEAAKTEARAKLAKTAIEIGTPSRDLDYTVQPMGRGSFGSNMLIASTWRHREEMRRIGRNNAERRWDVLPQEPALAYDIAHNRLIITAAVLQAPVLDMTKDMASHYGSFGALVGHELTHAVDDRGRMIDANNQVRDWWTPTDVAAWNGLLSRTGSQFDALAYPKLNGAKVNGRLVRDQALGDIAGMDLAETAMAKAMRGANTDNRKAFYEAWARLWAQQMSVEAATYLSTSAGQPPGQWRSNATLANQPGFALAYKCKVPGPMALPDASRVKVW
ncbi:M13-type metalloendopeptidase [Solilutibacter tolerans]|uniref:Putative endopeptidase n=1 Tax=Solilutibacter tolerans TaxID=1604334 RepID=A0A1N6NZY4_9GAMM|nr:M13 family metallopeptidase [Lysobacter tolerans]SIP97482.1 putative endopeptidase [Lysobacter tolerans]